MNLRARRWHDLPDRLKRRVPIFGFPSRIPEAPAQAGAFFSMSLPDALLEAIACRATTQPTEIAMRHGDRCDIAQVRPAAGEV
ncbi:MAG: hypothetical protein V4673_08520 [Pseudomonadota bacterium]